MAGIHRGLGGLKCGILRGLSGLIGGIGSRLGGLTNGVGSGIIEGWHSQSPWRNGGWFSGWRGWNVE